MSAAAVLKRVLFLFVLFIPAAQAGKFSDFNNDGRSDVFWRNAATGENYLYPMNGAAIGAGEGYLRTVADLNWRVVGIGDFDGNGKADVLWRNGATGENYIYFMNGSAIVAEGYIRAVTDQNWQVAGVGDFDGDTKSDILWRNAATGENYVYFMNGTAIAGEGYLRTVADLEWQVAGVDDFSGDGKSDIVWRNAVTGENYVYLMNGTAIAGEGYLRTVASLAWKIVGTGDFTGDGRADILWRNSATGENYIYFMNGTAIGGEGYLRTVADQGWGVQATGDYDGDGKADVLWRHARTGENYVYFMDGTAIKATEGFTRTVADQSWHVACGPAGRPCDPAVHRFPNAGLNEAPGVGGCPAGMVPIATFCIDRYEASLADWSPYHNPGSNAVRAVSIAGAIPQGYINAVQASAACANSGKRLCTNAEWLRACRTASAWSYPYGPSRVAGNCNDERSVHPVDELFPGDPDRYSKINNACINQLENSLARTGSYAACVSPEGVHDMVGNLQEWTADAAGTFRGSDYVGATVNGPGCNSATTAHDVNHWDYSTGFRCCADSP